MKLLFCNSCNDTFRLFVDSPTTCRCGATQGQYEEDGVHAWFTGPATPLGFANRSFVQALGNQPQQGPGRTFTAFVIEKDCPTFTKRD